MNGFTDIHAHFLYGIDDGAQTKQDMMDMLDAANADGVTSLFATPHMTPGIQPFLEDLYRQHLEEARSYCSQNGYKMTVYAGAEILYTPAIRHYAQAQRLITLADTEYVLVEFIPDIAYKEMEEAVRFLSDCGYVTIIAHIERYQCLRARGAYRLKRHNNIFYQVNAGTILAHQRGLKGHFVRSWLKNGLIDFVATDSHNCTTRPTIMKKAYEALEGLIGKEEALRLVSSAGR